jgi:hypothetical protein
MSTSCDFKNYDEKLKAWLRTDHAAKGKAHIGGKAIEAVENTKFGKTGDRRLLVVNRQALDIKNEYLQNAYRDILGTKEPFFRRYEVDGKQYIEINQNVLNELEVIHKEQYILDDIFNKEYLENKQKSLVAKAIIQKLSKSFNTPYAIVTSEEAQALVEATGIPYNGEAAFYTGEKIYLVEDKVTLETAFHEFGHVLIKGIKLTNRSLYDNLIGTLQATRQGQELIKIIAAEYPELKGDSDLIMEEALTTLLEQYSMKEIDEIEKTDPGFANFFRSLMFAIRKLLRKIFPTTRVENIDTNTTLEQLAKMMVKEDIFVDIPTNLVELGMQFKKDLQEANKKLAEKIGSEKLNNLINTVYKETQVQLNSLSNSPYILKRQLQKSNAHILIRSIRDQLDPYQSGKTIENSTDAEVLEATQKHYDEMHKRLLALIGSLNNAESFIDTIESALKSMISEKNTDSILSLQQVMFFESYLERQLNMVEELKREVKMPSDNELTNKLDNIENKVRANKDKIRGLKFEFVKNFFQDETYKMRPAVENLMSGKLQTIFKQKNYTEEQKQEILNKIIELEDGVTYTLKDVGLDGLDKTQSMIAEEAIKAYLAKRINNQMIEDFITGRRGDVDFFAANILPYSNIDDPILGSMVMWMRKIVSDAEQESITMRDNFMKKIQPLLNSLGYNPNNTLQLAEQLLTLDTIYVKTEGDKYERKQIYSFMDTHINWRADYEELKQKVKEAEVDGTPEEYREALAAQKDWEKKYLYQVHKKPYRDLQNIWNQENEVVNPFTNETMFVSRALSKEAHTEKVTKFNELRLHSSKSYKDHDKFADYSTEEQARKDYNQLFSVYNPDGSQKTGEELQKVLVRLKYRKESSKFYEYIPMTGQLQQDFNTFIQDLKAENITKELDPEEYDARIKEFEKRYMRKSFSETYYQELREAMDGLKEITDKYSSQHPQLQRKNALFAERATLINKDPFGSPDGTTMTPEATARVLEIDKELEKINQSLHLVSGLTKEEYTLYKDLNYKYSRKKSSMSAADIAKYEELDAKMQIQGMTPEDALLYDNYLNKFFELSSREATDYYFDAFLFAIGDVDVEQITKENADSYINNEELLEKAFTENPKFKEWFIKNHYQKETYRSGKLVTTWHRASQWNESIPNDPNHISKTVLKDIYSGEEVVLNGVPSGKYTYTRVKNEFLTIPFGQEKGYEGVYIDNKGNYLPRPYKPGDPESAFDDKYVNKEYEKIKAEGGARYELLKAMKEQALLQQKNAPKHMRLYYDLPRFGISNNLEKAQRGQIQGKFKTTAKALYDRANVLAKDRPADAGEFGFNSSLERKFVSTDMDGNELSRVHIRGLSALSPEETSLDVMKAMFDYMHSINLAKQKVINEPIGKAIRDVLSDKENGIKDMQKASLQIWKSTKAFQYISKTDNRRLKALEHLMDKFFYDDKYTSFESENPRITRVANMLMGAASRSFIALDVPSAMKNRWGMIFQNNIEAAAGNFMDFQSFGKGRIRSAKNIWELSSKGIYQAGNKPMDVEIMERFDPVASKTEKDFGKNASRSLMKDFFDLTWLYDFRRLAEVEASLQLFWGMMYKKDVPVRLADGTESTIKYADAFTKNAEGKLVLKEGINPEYGFEHVDYIVHSGDTVESIAKRYNMSAEDLAKKNNIEVSAELKQGKLMTISRNEQFNDFKFKVQAVGKRLNGIIQSLDGPQADKFLGYRMFTFYKKFATGMFLNRYQFDTDKDNRFGHVWDFEMGTMTRGWTVTGLASTLKMIQTGGKYYPHMTTEEKIAFRKILAEGVQILMIMGAVAMIFGYDMGDEDRFKKIRKREEDYGLLGWMANHTLYQLIMVKQENEAFTTYLGLNQWITYTDKTTIAFGPTVNLYAKIIYDLMYMVTGNDKARYKADVGPYSWQKEGEYKLWHHLLSTFGIKGKTWDPAHAIKLAEMFENLR